MKNGYDKFGRPCKDLYFMNLCFEVSKRSLDPNTKHGCVIVDRDSRILSTGYNSPPINCDDEIIPKTSPEKYVFFEHSERNAIYSAARNGTRLNLSTFYVTGIPCYDCLRGIMQVGARKIIYGPLNSIMCSKDGYFDNYNILLQDHLLTVQRFTFDNELFAMNNYAREEVLKKPKNCLSQEFNV